MAQIDKPNLHFATTLYTGNGSTDRAVTVGFQPDWIWCKERSQTESNMPVSYTHLTLPTILLV